jgi:RHS repeat-associated protein
MMGYRVRNLCKGIKTSFSLRAAFNLAALFVVGMMIVAPLEPAFAQDATTSGLTSVDTATSDTTGTTPDQSTTNTSTASPSTQPVVTDSTGAPTSQANVATPTPTVPTSPSSDTGTTNNTQSAPTNNAPSNPAPAKPLAQGALFGQGSGSPGPGSVAASFFNQSQFKIDQNSGAARITYPIAIPPGRNGIQPNVDLSYNSQNSQLGSIFGEGWSINIPYIQRLNKNGVDQLYSSSTPSYFMSTFDGQLSTTTVSGTYIARTENGTFNKYAFSNNQWTMIDKNGTQYLFGSTSDSSQNDPNNSADTYKWMLKTVTDTNGNSVTYNYSKDGGQVYPSSTIYTNTSSTTGIFEIDFLRASSTDNGTSSATGFAVNSNYRVSEIDAKVNGTWVRKYSLGYTTGDNGSTTLLSWIAESGQNASGTVVSLPSSTFSYQTQTSGWGTNSIWNPTISFTATSSVDDGVRVADVNGDGLPDIIQGYTDVSGATSSAAYINNGADWTVSSTWNPSISFSNNGVDQGVRVADVNGDGLPDIIQGFYNGTATTSVAYINTGTGWVVSSTWNPSIDFSNSGTDTGARIADVNGDGLPDIIQSYSDVSGVTHYAAYINNGNGWTLNPVWNPPALFIASGTTDVGTRLADVNGDGLPDVVQAYTDGGGTSHFATYMNTGNGWATSTTSIWNSPVVFANNGVDTGARIMDVNGDGLADIIQAYTDSGSANHFAAYLNKGNGWASASAWNPPITFTLNGTDNGTRTVDVNGDGLPDILQAYNDGSGVEHVSAYTNNNKFRADLLTSVTYPQGGSYSLAYQSILQLTDPNGTVLNGVPYPVYIVSSATQNDGLGNIASSSFVYYGGTYYTNGPFDHEFAGFTSVKATDPAGNVTKTYYDTSNGASSSTGQYADNFWKIGKAYRVESYDSNNHLYKVTITKWDSASLGSNAAYVFPDQTLEMDYDGLSTHQDLAESYAWNMATGNETQKIQWGQVTGSSTGAFATSTQGYTTNLSYASTTGSNVIGKLSDETLSNPSSTKIQEAQYYYDGLSQGNVGVGNLTKQLDWKSGSTYVTIAQNTYNSYGLVAQALDPRNNTTTYTYDAYNLYPATTTNALSQSTGNQYDYSTGKVTQAIDPNKLIFQTVYDGVGRPLQALQPDQVTTSTLDTKTTYTYTDTSGAVSVHESDYLNATTTVDMYGYYDGLNRPIQTRKSATDAGTYKVTDQAYNNVSLLQKASLPYFASSSGQAAATTTAALFTNYAYDPLGRVLATTNVVGAVSDAYNNWKTTITDANGNQKDVYHDAFGNLVQVGEHNGSSTYTTYYTYDGLHDLLNLTDANGNIRSFAYDGLGRMVSSTDLHASTSSTYGVWNYTYDDAGNLTTRVDPKNQTVNYTYDGLNRALTEDFTGATGTEIMYAYDTCMNGVGRLCTVSSTDAVSFMTKTYDALGNLASETKTINGINYTTSYTYNRQGNQLTITNPDNSVIQYTYGTGGLPTSVQEEEPGGSFSSVVSSINYSPTDQIAIETYADGIVAKNIYDPLQLYRLIGKVTTDNQGQMHPMLLRGGGGLGPLALGGALNTAYTITQRYTGAITSFTVPIGVASLTIAAYGGQGGGGGLGGAASGTFGVTSGTVYYYGVGQVGGNGSSTNNGASSGGGGGGMTWFGTQNSFSQATVLVAGGGGGGGAGAATVNSGSSEPGGVGGFGGGGNGGSTNGFEGGSGGAGGGYWGGNGLSPGTQTFGYAAGQGSNGVNSNGGIIPSGGGAGGGGGGLSGASGTQQFYNGSYGASGGGGGSAYIASALVNTSTAPGVNSGNGYLTITEYPAATVYAPYFSSSSPNQYHLDGVTQLSRGSSTTEGGVTFSAMLNSSGTLGVQFQVEVEPMGKNFTNIPNVTSTSFMVPNQIATTTFYGLNGGYHWQAQIVDVFGNSSGWQRFSTSTYTTDFILTAPAMPTNATETYSGSIGSFTVPSDVAKLTITEYGAQGAASSTNQAVGGLGGEVSFTTQTVPGTTLYYRVGGQGGSSAGGGDMTWISSTSTFSTSTAWAIAGGGGSGGISKSGGCSSLGSGAGGIGGGTTGGNGAQGGYDGYGQGGLGGGGGSQIAGGGGGAGQNGGGNGITATSTVGGSGGPGYGCGGATGGAGGSGFFGGGGGAGGGNGGNASDFGGGGGGGGGSSYINASSSFTSTNIVSGMNSGNGYISITEYHNAPIIASFNQYHLDGITPLGEGSSTIENGAVLGATLNTNATSTQSTELYNTSLYSDANLMDYYRLENASDTKGSNNLTATGTVNYDPAKFNNGADFGASNSTSKLYNSYAYDGPLTISFWVKLKSEITSGSWILATAGTNGGSPWTNQGVLYRYNGGTITLRFTKDRQNVAEYDADYPIALGTSNWYHIVYTYDGTNIRGYVNGSLVAGPVAASGNGTGGATSAISVGGISPGGYFQNAGYASAAIDDLAYFSRALSSTEVANLAAGTSTSGAQLQVEVEPAGVNFANVANVTSSAFVTPPGGYASTSFMGPSGNYHWQARAVDALNNTSGWHAFNSSSTGLTGPIELYGTSLYSDSNLAAYYRLEGNANDSKGSNNGTASNVTFGSTYGEFGQGANFNGNNSAISIPTTALHSTNSSLSVSAWVNFPSYSSGNGVQYVLSSNNWQFDVEAPPQTGYQLGVFIGGNGYKMAYTPALNTWHLIAFSYNYASGTIAFYADGSLLGTTSGVTATNVSTTVAKIGMIYNQTATYGYNGNIDDLAIFNRVLTATEVTNLYTGNWSGNSGPFDLTIDNLYFSYPANATTVPQFSNWQLKARNVTSTNSYAVQVNWGLTQPNQATSTLNASGSQLLSGVNVLKTLFSGDYTDTGDPVGIVASGTLTDITGTSTVISTTTVSFNEQTIPATSNCTSSNVQCIAYTYDANGNITKIVDNSASQAAITVNYAYDGLNRLISASSSNATSGVNYYQTYTYDPVGNLLSGPAGTYTYAGGGYTDPDAATKIVNGTSTTTFTYDNDGNLTNASSGFTYAWDYNNHLLTASSSNSTSTYGYDYTGARVSVANGGAATYYPETTYNVNSSTITKNIFADGLLVSTIANTTSTGSGGSGTSTPTLTATSTSITNGYNGGPITKSWSHTVTGTSTVIILMGDLWQDVGGTGTIASATWKGVPFTKIKSALSVNIDAELWYLVPTSTGSGTLSVTVTGATDAIKLGAATFNGVATSSPINTSSSATGVSGTPSVSATTTISGDLIVATLSRYTTANATSNRTAIFRDNSNSTLAAGSYQIATSTGSYSDTYTGSASQDWSMVMVAVKPATTSGGGSTSTSTTVGYVLTDHLGGANVVTNTSGTILEALQYFPYGSLRIDTATSSYSGGRKYIGQMYDGQTQLVYDNARYYSGAQGQFLSEDPVFLGVPKQQIISDPQSLNAYSYSGDNPITKSDPTGKCIEDLCVGETALAVGFAVETEPEWGPALQDAVTSIGNDLVGAYGETLGNETAYGSISSQAEGYGFNMAEPNGSTIAYQAGTEQPTVPSLLEDYYQKGGYEGQTLNDYVDYFKALARQNPGVLKGVGILGGLGILGYEWPKSDNQPSRNSGGSNGNGGGTYGTRPSISTPTSMQGGRSGGGGPALLPGQNAQSRYTFSGGVNAYGESYGQVFPSTKH